MKNKLKTTLVCSLLLIYNSAFACNQYCEGVIASKMATIASLTATYSATLAGQTFNGFRAGFLPVSMGGNIYAFCTKGEFINELGDQGWVKLSPATGTWAITNRDVFAGIGNPEDVAKYVALCPYGGFGG